MSLDLNHDYEKKLLDAQPTFLKPITIRPPDGALGDIITVHPQTIPPINTNIQFDILPTFEISQHPGLAAMDITQIPSQFNWRENGGNKSSLISTPGNQMLCGSCWAISAAGLVADNHVVSGTVDWKPNLSTTWCLACYPQNKCKGGNPAKLYNDIAKNGIATKHCVDYSWCSENEACNGKATKHFKAGADLSSLVPSCGCYEGSEEHYLYHIETPKTIALGTGGMDKDNFTSTVKKHIYKYGPVQGGFLVFNNFRPGAFTKVNGGVYLENGVYDGGKMRFNTSETSASNYVGSHAIAILGWGLQKDVVVDNNGSKKDVPYWYCRNSWTEKWGDGGYFKMAMYPFNKISQFDKMVRLSTPKGAFGSGGIVMIRATKAPELKTLGQIQKKFLSLTREQSDDYYKVESKDGGKISDKISKFINSKNIKLFLKIILFIFIIILFLILLRFLFRKFKSIDKPGGKSSNNKSSIKSSNKSSSGSSGGSYRWKPSAKTGRSGSYGFK